MCSRLRSLDASHRFLIERRRRKGPQEGREGGRKGKREKDRECWNLSAPLKYPGVILVQGYLAPGTKYYLDSWGSDFHSCSQTDFSQETTKLMRTSSYALKIGLLPPVFPGQTTS